MTEAKEKIEGILNECRNFLSLLCDHTPQYCFRVGNYLYFDTEAYIMETKVHLQEYVSVSQGQEEKARMHIDSDEVDGFLRRLISTQHWSVYITQM